MNNGFNKAQEQHDAETPEEEVLFKVCGCGTDIFIGDDYFNINSNIMCEECSDRFLEGCRRTAGEE